MFKTIKKYTFLQGILKLQDEFKQGLPYNFEYADGYYVEFKPEWISHPEQIPTLAQIRSRPLSDPCDISCVYLKPKIRRGLSQRYKLFKFKQTQASNSLIVKGNPLSVLDLICEVVLKNVVRRFRTQ